MGSKFTVSYEERIDAIEKYLRYEYSMNDLSKQLKVSNTTIRRWLARYQSLGPEGLQETSKNLPYSSELKEAVVMDYLSGIGFHMDLCKKYGIKSTRQLRNWISKYMVMRS
jgi:transposase-like protein